MKIMDLSTFFNHVEKNEIEKIDFAVSRDIDVNTKNRFGSTALHIAVYKGFTEMVNRLIEIGINVNGQNKEGKTALHYVAEYNNIQIAKTLLSNKADLTIADIYGNQPLWTAVFNDKGRNDRLELIKIFMYYGADVNHRNNVNKTPLDIVKIAGYKNLESILNGESE